MDFHGAVMPETLVRDSLSLEDLIVAVGASQDRSAFARLFAHFAPRIKTYLVRTGTDFAVADELTQEVMLLVWRKADRFDPAQANAATWIFTIARNRRIDSFRRDRRAELDPDDPTLLPDPEPAADHRLDAAEKAAQIDEAIRMLPDEQSRLLRQAFFDGKSHSAIAAESSLPLGTVKSRLRLALARLRISLTAEEA